MRNTTRKIETLPTGSFRVRVYRDEQHTSRTFKTLAEAEHFNQQINRIGVDAAIAALYKERYQAERNRARKRISLRNYMLTYAELRNNVNAEYREFLRRVANSLGKIGDVRISDIEREDVQRIIQHFIDAGNAPKTVRNKYMAIASAIKAARDEGLLLTNPCARPDLPKLDKHQMQTLELNEIPIFLEIMHPHYKPFTQTLFRTGLRFGEITALEVRHFDPKQRVLHVNQAWADRGKKIRPPKTSHSNRIINVPNDVHAILTKACKGKAKNDLIFLTVNESRIIHSTFYKVWQKALRILNGDRTHRPAHITPKRFAKLPIIDKHLRIHDARHTYASILVNGGAPMDAVSDLLGHEDYQTTAKRYAHL
ncbi:MAG: site-specific integrase, partial [Bifidobacteriaceae bacterium]|nr:site-specific integrase [Bifidobacteriaceae bacterium]